MEDSRLGTGGGALKVLVVVLLAGLGLLFLLVDTLITAGTLSASGASWLLPAGLASWCASWLVSVLPVP
jgi:hypothetical protein